MSDEVKIRWGWLKFMYALTIVGAGGFGLGMLVAPDVVKSMSGIPCRDPIIFGINGSVYVAFGLVSVLGLRAPLKFVPVLVMQLCYKTIWLVGIILPLLAAGQLPGYAVPLIGIFAVYIIGDLIAIPFRYVFTAQSEG